MALSTSETIFWVKDSSQPFANDGVDFDFKAKQYPRSTGRLLVRRIWIIDLELACDMDFPDR
jgi:hypothetical protein